MEGSESPGKLLLGNLLEKRRMVKANGKADWCLDFKGVKSQKF